MHQLQELFKKLTNSEATTISALSGAGSNRVYYRLKNNCHSFIGVQGEIDEENESFIYLSRHFNSIGLRVPVVKIVSNDSIFYLQEDLGDTSLYDLILQDPEFPEHSPDITRLLERCICDLADFQFLGRKNIDFSKCYPVSDFDERAIMWDMNAFKYYFLRPSGIIFNERLLEEDLRIFAESCASDKTDTFMYRDFQSRNIMICNNTPYYIDFQGGRKGPFIYDLISFLGQAKARFSPSLKNHLTNIYTDKIKEYRQVSSEYIRNAIAKYTLLRLLQVLSAYGYRGYFERKSHFLDSIPPALDNLETILVEAPPANCTYLLNILTDMICKLKYERDQQ